MKLSTFPGINIGNKETPFSAPVEGVKGATRALLSLNITPTPKVIEIGENPIKNDRVEPLENRVQPPEATTSMKTPKKISLDKTPPRKSGRDGNKPPEISKGLWDLLQAGRLALGTIGHPVGVRIKGRKGSGGKGFGTKS